MRDLFEKSATKKHKKHKSLTTYRGLTINEQSMQIIEA